jgi:hypothetical protein
MKRNIFQLFIFVILWVSFPIISQASLEDAMKKAMEYAGAYALKEMRPTARFSNATTRKYRKDGESYKGRVNTYWVTAFTGRNRETVIDVWLQVKSNGLYLVRYKLYTDDHNITIMNRTDVKMNKLLISSSGSSTEDDF